MSSSVQRHVFEVTMACDGCKVAVTKLVQKVPKVESFDVDLTKQQLVVSGSEVDPQEVLNILTPWAKSKDRTLKYTGIIDS